MFCSKRTKMFNVFDFILATCFIAIVCAFFNIPGPWMWLSLPAISSAATTSDVSAPPPEKEQGHTDTRQAKEQIIQNQETKVEEDMAGKVLVSVDFEVFGKVQGVFFRKFTRDTAKKHRIVGTVKNTMTGTVLGVAQGPQDKIDFMKHWLQYEGSPYSTISRAEFRNERRISELEYAGFNVDDSY